MEEWRPLKEYPGYEVSSLAQVRSPNSIILKPSIDQLGYQSFRLCSHPSKPRRRLHQLVAAAFIGPRPDKYDTDHIDRNKKNCLPSNLRYTTRSLNMLNSRQKRSKSGFEGVSYWGVKKNLKNKWRARAVYRGKEYWLGYFPTPEAAYVARRKFVAAL